MKQKAIYFLLIILISVTFISCSDKQANSITITNNAALGVQLNFRGTLTDIIAPGGSVVLSDILPGEYEYETIFQVPANSTYDASESCAGTFVLNAGTDILIVYVSVYDGTNYSVTASITTSDNLSESGILPDPIGP
jgi:hypothetical protein